MTIIGLKVKTLRCCIKYESRKFEKTYFLIEHFFLPKIECYAYVELTIWAFPRNKIDPKVNVCLKPVNNVFRVAHLRCFFFFADEFFSKQI